MKYTLYKIYEFVSGQLGIDVLKLLKFPRGLISYFRDFAQFKSCYSGKYSFRPCLHDKFEESGSIRTEYFWQDLLMAQEIFRNAPEKHLDVGSRIDGFVANVASFMPIEVFDIRSLNLNIPNITFTKIDLMSPSEVSRFVQSYDSISCLHTLEHFGLGRYGDLIDVSGYIKGFTNLSSLLCSGGTMYFSTPIGKEIVEFNANRIFNPNTILNLANDNNLEIVKMLTISDGYKVEILNTEDLKNEIDSLSKQRYKLGLFVFRKR